MRLNNIFSLVYIEVSNQFFCNNRAALAKVLDKEFCGGVADQTVMPSCGATCNIQEDTITVIDSDGQGFATGCDVSFMMVVSTLAGQTTNIEQELRVLHGKTRTIDGFELQPGSFGGKKVFDHKYGIGLPTFVQNLTP